MRGRQTGKDRKLEEERLWLKECVWIGDEVLEGGVGGEGYTCSRKGRKKGTGRKSRIGRLVAGRNSLITLP